jgi:hypothetical protein
MENGMQVIKALSLSAFTLFIAVSGVSAQAPLKTISRTLPLTSTLQPVYRNYRGVSADILGIRTGMSVAKVETIAKKSLGDKDKPQLLRSHASLVYGPGNFTIQSSPFITEIIIDHSVGIVDDYLTLYFSSPVSDNTLWAMSRRISYYGASGQQVPPTVSTLQSLLIKKYGPTSYQAASQDGELSLAWVFGPKERVVCKTHDCLGGTFLMDAPAFLTGAGKRNDDVANSALAPCGTTAGYPNLFRITAKIEPNKSAKGQARGMTVSMWDASACMNDMKGAENQLMANAIKYYRTTRKPSPAPRL